MRRVIWVAAILILMAISFGFGRLGGGAHSLPAMVATIPGEEAEWRRRDAANSSALIPNGLICQKLIRVVWRADAAGAVTNVSGAYQSHCL
jgi:hypothetical protein